MRELREQLAVLLKLGLEPMSILQPQLPGAVTSAVSWSLCFSPRICLSVDVKHVGALSAILDTEFRDILPGDVYSSFIPVVKDAISTERYYPDFLKALLLFISEKFL